MVSKLGTHSPSTFEYQLSYFKVSKRISVHFVPSGKYC